MPSRKKRRRLPNPTIYKYPKQFVPNADGTVSQVERSLRLNGDVSIIVKVKDSGGRIMVVYHVAKDSSGRIVHGPHDEPGSRRRGYRGTFPLDLSSL